MITNYKPEHALLSWNERGLPWSERYGDVYYSRADALGESTHVFLDGNLLPERFAGCEEQFTIGELGFGAGLNFLNACRLWCRRAPAGARLHYLACELHPLRAGDLRKLLRGFPELDEYGAALLAQYPDHTIGPQQLEFRFGDRGVTLTLLYGEASAMFGDCAAQRGCGVDAWFLDGFAPKTNPAMWQGGLLRQLAALSHAGTTLASYSVAGEFRQQLEEAGFDWEKLPGFAGKKHMLRARPATGRRHFPGPRTTKEPGTVCIVGAGLAGCSTAWMLARSGWRVVLLERGERIAGQASGNPQGILHFKPGTRDSAANRFNLQAFLYAARFYRALGLAPDTWSACGMLQLAHDARLEKRFAKLAETELYDEQVLRVLDPEQAGAVAGLPLERSALHFPFAGWLSPPRLCEYYCSHPNIHLHCGQEVTLLDRGRSGWEIMMHSEHGEQLMHAHHLVLCNSADVHRFEQSKRVPVICNRGQVDVYPANDDSAIDIVLCGQGYILPGCAGEQSLGGSFFVGPDDAAMREANRDWHLRQLQGIDTGLAAAISRRAPLRQRIATRCTVADRMPVCGVLEQDENSSLWINTAHGSHGLARTPVCAALLASRLNRSPAPLDADCIGILAPRRFGT